MANLEQNLENRQRDDNPDNPDDQDDQEKQINLTRNFTKIARNFILKYKNNLKISHF